VETPGAREGMPTRNAIDAAVRWGVAPSKLAPCSPSP
jgi:hypothetical protein